MVTPGLVGIVQVRGISVSQLQLRHLTYGRVLSRARTTMPLARGAIPTRYDQPETRQRQGCQRGRRSHSPSLPAGVVGGNSCLTMLQWPPRECRRRRVPPCLWRGARVQSAVFAPLHCQVSFTLDGKLRLHVERLRMPFTMASITCSMSLSLQRRVSVSGYISKDESKTKGDPSHIQSRANC